MNSEVIMLSEINQLHTYTHTHTHTHTMEFYSAIKKNETRPFAATGMDIEYHTG